MRQYRLNRWKGLVLGLSGGAAGTLTMNYYWQAVVATTGEDPRQETSSAEQQALDDISLVGQQARPDESSTAAIGRIAYETVTGSEPNAEEMKTTLSNAVHFGYGIAQGGVYGVLRGKAVVPDILGGAVFGAALWLFGDELGIPLLGFSQGPTAYPVHQHIHRFAAHLIYGLTTSAVTQVLRRFL